MSEKTETQKIREQLGHTARHPREIPRADEYAEGYKAFLNAAKTEREAVAFAVETAEKAGFRPFVPGMTLKAGDKVYRNNRGKSLMLAVIGRRSIAQGVSIAGAHIDSPRLDLKPNPLYENGRLAYFDTHYYGGIKKYQWTAIPLSLHGVIVKKDGETVPVKVGEDPDDPVFCVTDLLPHLAGEQMKLTASKVVAGEALDVLIGSRPLSDEEGSDLVKLNILRLLNEKYGITEDDFLSAELEVVPAFQARDLGLDRSMVGAYGHDDRVCAYPALTAILSLDIPLYTAVTVLTDKEETGSDGVSGMESVYLPNFIDELAEGFGEKGSRVLSRSLCLSADVNIAFDPLYPDVTEQHNCAVLNGGVVLTKYTGSGGKGGTSDASAELMARMRRIMDDAGVLWQAGELGKVDVGGGGTIAKCVANLDVDTVDLGVPVLSMHAPLEVVAKSDIYEAHKAFSAMMNRE